MKLLSVAMLCSLLVCAMGVDTETARQASGVMNKRMATRRADAPKVVVDAANPQPIPEPEVRAAPKAPQGDGYMSRWKTQMADMDAAMKRGGKADAGAGNGAFGDILKNLDMDSLMKDPAMKKPMDSVVKALTGTGEKGAAHDDFAKSLRQVSGELMDKLNLNIPKADLDSATDKLGALFKGRGADATAAAGGPPQAAGTAGDAAAPNWDNPKALDDLIASLFGGAKTDGKDRPATNWMDGLFGRKPHDGFKHAGKSGNQQLKEEAERDYGFFSEPSDSDMGFDL